ncbi:MAG: hypothetical protein P8J55_00670 [Pseudomonadales bacterium]|nr:hypothetical protein [Pseudomonadales bacterium]
MQSILILIRREFWENRNTFFPYVIVGLVVLVMLAIFVGGGETSVTVNSGTVALERNVGFLGFGADLFRDMSVDERRNKLGLAYVFISAAFVLMLSFVVFFYLLDCLYRDRKDRSILFWKSLPVSDWLTVGSKLFTGLVCVPVVYFLFIVVTQFIFLLGASLAAFSYDVSVWSSLWQPSTVVFGIWADMWFYYAVLILWQLPLYSWIIFVSSFAKSVPFVWVVGIPLAVVGIEASFGVYTIANWIGHHVVPQIGDMNLTGVGDIVDRIVSLDFLITLVVSGILVSGAVWFRSKADEM